MADSLVKNILNWGHNLSRGTFFRSESGEALLYIAILAGVILLVATLAIAFMVKRRVPLKALKPLKKKAATAPDQPAELATPPEASADQPTPTEVPMPAPTEEPSQTSAWRELALSELQYIRSHVDFLEKELSDLRSLVNKQQTERGALPPTPAPQGAAATGWDAASGGPHAPPALPPPPPPPPAKKAVVCDDDATLSQIYQHILKKLGFTAYWGANGEEGLNLIRSEKPALVLLDLDMPVKRGEEVLEELYADGTLGNYYVIVLSARENPEKQQWVKTLGAKDVMVKPFSPNDLIKKIEKLMQEGVIK